MDGLVVNGLDSCGGLMRAAVQAPSSSLALNRIAAAHGPSDFTTIGVLLLLAIVIAAGCLVLTHAIGPKRRGAVKDSTYESGMTPYGDTRRRFNVRFYIVAMLFLLFDVEIVFFYPWATLYPRLNDGQHAGWAGPVVAAGFGPWYFLLMMVVFIAILLVGYVYAWRKGVFRWD